MQKADKVIETYIILNAQPIPLFPDCLKASVGLSIKREPPPQGSMSMYQASENKTHSTNVGFLTIRIGFFGGGILYYTQSKEPPKTVLVIEGLNPLSVNPEP